MAVSITVCLEIEMSAKGRIFIILNTVSPPWGEKKLKAALTSR